MKARGGKPRLGKAGPASGPQKRFRDLFPEQARSISSFQPGPVNAITDVSGVKVGHCTIRDPRKKIFTGVTAIWPRRDVYRFRPRASAFVLHGAGEVTGFHQVAEWGVLETPILLTSTLNVGRVHDATVEYMLRRYPSVGRTDEVILPVIAECDDSYLSRSPLRAVGRREVFRALDGAAMGPVGEGAVGAGTGMVAFDYGGGIGTASRVVGVGQRASGRGRRATTFRLGALVNANVGLRRQLRWGGEPLGRKLPPVGSPDRADRSIIVVLATDAPMLPHQLRQVAVRGAMGLARAGSFASHASGEIVIAFSTSLGEPALAREPVRTIQALSDSHLNPFYEAAVECVEESVLNALVAGSATLGRDGHSTSSIPLDELLRFEQFA